MALRGTCSNSVRACIPIDLGPTQFIVSDPNHGLLIGHGWPRRVVSMSRASLRDPSRVPDPHMTAVTSGEEVNSHEPFVNGFIVHGRTTSCYHDKFPLLRESERTKSESVLHSVQWVIKPLHRLTSTVPIRDLTDRASFCGS